MATMLRATSTVFSFGSRNVPETGEATESSSTIMSLRVLQQANACPESFLSPSSIVAPSATSLAESANMYRRLRARQFLYIAAPS